MPFNNSFHNIITRESAACVRYTVGTGTSSSTTYDSDTYTVLTYTSTGTLKVYSNLNVYYLVVGGGGSGGGIYSAGGGGGGGVIYNPANYMVIMSPGTYNITVGAAGAASSIIHQTSSIFSVTANNGGNGTKDYGAGGSSGSASASYNAQWGTTYSAVSAYSGGNGNGNDTGAGGGGANGAGNLNDGGSAKQWFFNSTSYGGGGGGGTKNGNYMNAVGGNTYGGIPGTGGGYGGARSHQLGTGGTANTGGGGGGVANTDTTLSGGSGIVILAFLTSNTKST